MRRENDFQRIQMTEPTKSAKPNISCRPNGPLIVEDLPLLKNSMGEDIPTKPVIALCRCGGSENKPFCDGTHSRNGFSGENTEEPERSEQIKYEGAGVTVLDARRICAHVGACTDALSAVFLLGKEPWIDPDGADTETVIRSVDNCPSGALAYAMEGAGVADQERETVISVIKNGPYAVEGIPDFRDEATGQRPFAAERYTLCRCGHSKNKPFCDGSHWSAEFKDEKN
jgi:CDGSH-type Zn-finger protein